MTSVLTSITYPIEFIMEYFLELVHELSGDYGIGLIAVSFILSIGVLPLYHLAELWQGRERDIQRKLRPKIKEFKSVFKKYELHLYLKALYRQNGYHPIYSLRSFLGIMMQIPFYFAAYHLLSNYSLLNGEPFLWIKDLSKPDGLIPLNGTVSINLLPFLMTAVNIISTLIYSTKLERKEKLQLYGIAAAFFFLLYNAASALLLYWTFNNIFSLLKNILYRVFENRSKFSGDVNGYIDSISVKACSLIKKFSTPINSLYSHSFYSHGFFLIISIGMYHIFSQKLFNHYIDRDTALIFSNIAFMLLSLLTLIKSFSNRSDNSPIPRFLLFGLLFWLSSATVFILNFTNITNIYRQISLHLSVLAYISLLFPKLSSFIGQSPLKEKEANFIFTLSVSIIAVLFFGVVPLSLLSTAGVSDFNKPLTYYLSSSIPLMMLFMYVSLVIYFVSTQRNKKALCLLMLFASLLLLGNVFILPGNYGDMSHFAFAKGLKIKSAEHTKSAIMIILIACLVIFILKAKQIKTMRHFLSISLIALLLQCGMSGYTYEKMRIDGKSSGKAAKKYQREIAFSKTGQNVVVLMLDRFIGGYFQKALNSTPQVDWDDTFDGFTWYPKSLSQCAYTICGLPGIMGGWDYTAKKIKNERGNLTLKEKLDESLRVLPYNVKNAGYDFNMITKKVSWHIKENSTYLKKEEFLDLYKKYSSLWWWKRVDDSVRERLVMFSLFRISPPKLRSKIYDNGNWHLTADHNSNLGIVSEGSVSFKEGSRGRQNRTKEEWKMLDTLPLTSKIVQNGKNQFHFIINELPHEPWAIDSNFQLSINKMIKYPKKLYKEFDNSLYSLKHYYTNVATLLLVKKWFAWMKKEGIYDNTKIILVSDHGRDVHNPMFKKQLIDGSKIYKSAFHNLLLVKDFNSRGKITQSEEFRTVFDVPSMILKDVVANPVNPFTGKKLSIRKNYSSLKLFETHWHIGSQKKYEYNVKESFEVSPGNIFTNSNWKKTDVF